MDIWQTPPPPCHVHMVYEWPLRMILPRVRYSWASILFYKFYIGWGGDEWTNQTKMSKKLEEVEDGGCGYDRLQQRNERSFLAAYNLEWPDRLSFLWLEYSTN